ncbi:MAG TPA: response regulator [Burkholderiales bacterium]|jgi:DNA-binding response OmpR family regulator|nr:response regulator [Burkholderiales bacterium]
MDEPSTILVVDEDPAIRDVLVQKLEALGYRTFEARNGREALDQVARTQPDLILLDVMMPVMDGFQACRVLKDDEETRLIPIIIMTALHAVEDRIRGAEVGADDFLTKPVDDRELEARIRSALRMKHTIGKKLRRTEQVRDHYAKFVPEVVKRLVAANPDAPELGKSDQDAAFVFVDISGYTALSERVAADALSQLVERYFSAFLDRIHEHGGEISGTAGDGLLVIFHRVDPVSHSRMAAKTALSLMDVTDELTRTGLGPPVEVHIGISSGRAAVGSTRFEGLRGTRWVYSAEGFVINLGSRLADLAQAGQILICPESARRLGNTYQLQPLGPRKLQGIAEAMDVFRLGGPCGIEAAHD